MIFFSGWFVCGVRPKQFQSYGSLSLSHWHGEQPISYSSLPALGQLVSERRLVLRLSLRSPIEVTRLLIPDLNFRFLYSIIHHHRRSSSSWITGSLIPSFIITDHHHHHHPAISVPLNRTLPSTKPNPIVTETPWTVSRTKSFNLWLWKGPGWAWVCPFPTYNICRAEPRWTKALWRFYLLSKRENSWRVCSIISHLLQEFPRTKSFYQSYL